MTLYEVFPIHQLALVLAIGLVSCDPPPEAEYDLPPDWGEAEHHEIFLGPDKPASEPDDAEVLLAVANGEQVRLYYRGVFPCLELNEAFVRPASSGGFDVLVQPVDTHPDDVFACGSDYYDLRLHVGPGQAGTPVTLYRRGSDKGSNYPNPVLVGTAVAAASHEDCDHLVPCGVDSPCAEEGFQSDELTNWTLGCFQLPSCDGAYCAWDGEACMMECGYTGCAVLESYPAQLDCATL